MYSSLAVFGLAATAMAKAIPQGVTQAVTAPGAPAPGCTSDFGPNFQISVVNNTTPARMVKRQDPNLSPGMSLVLSVKGGILKNAEGDTGYIAENYQLQFDNPPQTGAGYTAGFSVCGPTTTTDGQAYFLALGSSQDFTACRSTDQTGRMFNNLYNQTGRDIDPSFCSPIKIRALPEGSTGGSASQAPDNQPQASSASPGVTQVSDMQPQASSAAPAVTQVSDNQPQASSAAPAVTQISDNQPQAGSAAPPVTQISDNQPQAPTMAPAVTQISDNQPQAPTMAPAVTQISDNQPQAPATPARSPAPVYTGAAAANGLSNIALAGAAAVGLAML